MTPERWQRVKNLFHSALERESNQRALFLDEACAGDELLHKEVESLLASHEQTGSFIDSPAYELGAELLTEDPAQLSVGQHIAHYKILALLGSGGMGEVYLAQDVRLGRKIALKLLPAQFTTDRNRLRRFEQEAHAASTLSHPSVCMIHEVGETEDGRHYIAMEYVDGVTLSQHITETRMQIGEALDVAIQVGSALAAAHEAGIVHRDIKPENIMLRRDGYIKVLDFGLAKLTEPQATDLAATPTALVKTDTGVVMGTSRYMSPEQVRGLAVDARTDIWSLGVVIYEMVTGGAPFEGATTSDVIVSILEREPLPITSHSSEGPAELQRIVKKALSKERAERYQTVKDMAFDLKSLKQELEFEGKQGRSIQPELSSGATAERGDPLRIETVPGPALRTEEVQAVRTTSSAEYIITEIKRHRKSIVVTLSVVAITIAAIGFGLYRFSGRNKSVVPFQKTKITKLTTGKALHAAISPDGKYVAYVLDEGAGQQSLWVRQVAVASNIRIVPPAEVQYTNLTYTHDGNYIYYGVLNTKGDFFGGVGALYQVPALGGDARRLIENVYSPITLSPDDKRLAYIEIILKEGNVLMVANADGTGKKKLSNLQQPDYWVPVGPAWSPDGKVIVCIAGSNVDNTDQGLVEVRVEDGSMRRITSQKWWWIGHLEWMRDGSGLVMLAPDRSVSFAEIWYLSYPSGEARKITNDLTSYGSVSLTADSRTLIATQTALLLNIWVMPAGDPSRAKQITSGASTYFDLSWTPDGKIVYSSNASGNGDIWILAADGTGQKQLTSNAGENFGPSVSPDGRYIVFGSGRTGPFKIWRMNIDGTNPKQLSTGSVGHNYPTCSPDGQWVVYTSSKPTDNIVYHFPLWKIPIEGGEPVQLNDKFTVKPEVSPDGKMIACFYTTGVPEPSKLAIIPFAGGPPIKIFDVVPTVDQYNNSIHWTADGRALTYRDGRSGAINIWSQPLSGGKPIQLTDFKSDLLYSFGWSRDGKQLAYSRGVVTHDVVMMSDVK
jgi:serine/threonine protein kinase/Tol biopolymer transport system component